MEEALDLSFDRLLMMMMMMMKTCDWPICFPRNPTRGLVLLYSYLSTRLDKSIGLQESETPKNL